MNKYSRQQRFYEVHKLSKRWNVSNDFNENSNIMVVIIKSILVISFLILFQNCKAQTTGTKEFLSNERQQEVINKFKIVLTENYIFPETALTISNKLDSVYKMGHFESEKSESEFTDLLNNVIKSVVQDNHLGIKYKPNYHINPQTETVPRMRLRQPGNTEMHEPVEFKILENSIGYLRLDMFDEQPIFYDKIDEAFRQFSNVKTLIIDLRNCGGGSPKAENYVISYLLNSDTQLSSIFQRKQGTIIEEKYYTLKEVKGKRFTEKPVYVLTGNKTFSAAENFCYDLQALKRVTIVGINTLGGANPGKEFPIVNSFYAFIPTGRSYNYITKSNWEGVGIKPDVIISEKEALTKTLSIINSK